MLIGMMICPTTSYILGYFWCEWLEGEHYSIDYRRGKNWKGGEDWVPWNACQSKDSTKGR